MGAHGWQFIRCIGIAVGLDAPSLFLIGQGAYFAALRIGVLHAAFQILRSRAVAGVYRTSDRFARVVVVIGIGQVCDPVRLSGKVPLLHHVGATSDQYCVIVIS